MKWNDKLEISPLSKYIVVPHRMAIMANRDQVLFCVVAGMTSKLLMMHFEVGHGSAELAAPPIPQQDDSTKLFVLLALQANRSPSQSCVY